MSTATISRRALTRTSAVLIGTLTATTLFTAAATADTADDSVPVADAAGVVDDASTVSLEEEGLFELQAPDDGEVHTQNFSSSVNGWVPGSKESRHWADNDYTEIKFTGCTMTEATGRSLDVQLHQAIPFGLDKSIGSKRFSNCFKGSSKTSRGEWDAHYSNGDNRYFTIPKHNGSEYQHTHVSVKKVYVDVSKAD
ncbi:hypothetical protein ACIG3E_10670 [Streptomyces sp. NPDC053474]|uniref:hypothetical protein n=1 Tax=Streptomyces sp. NPDC053474 TaxID=3365704 RepID=UPI0037CEDA05